MADNTKRFSSRVADYTKYRPGYPPAIIEYLEKEFGLSKNATVADVGSGTGIFSQLLLGRAARIFAVEPNLEMREEAERRLGAHTGFVSVDASAENTGLPAASVDMICSAQAFHWFDLDKAKIEFRRILKPSAPIVIVWNKRLVDTPFLENYETCLAEFVREYKEVNHTNVTPKMLNSFMDGGCTLERFSNTQVFDLDGVFGRLNSSSYAPARGTALYATIEEKIRDAFARYNVDGYVEFHYEAEVYAGRFR